MLKPKLKSARHHWRPIALLKYWADANGTLTRLDPNGHQLTLSYEKHAAIGNAHHVKLGDLVGHWDYSCEPIFSIADAMFPSVVAWLQTLITTTSHTPNDSILATDLSAERRASLAECVASLIVRSPRFRNTIEISMAPARIGLSNSKVTNSLIATNIANCYRAIIRSLKNSARIAVLSTTSSEYIFGDGFLHNFGPFPDENTCARCIVPLTPTLTLALFRTLQYRAQPELVVIPARPDDVMFLNRTVQVYSRDYIFYRARAPELSECFRVHQYLEYPRHRHDRIEQLFHEILQYHGAC